MRLIRLLKKTGKAFAADNCPRMAAALAYYTIFSLPPLLLVVVSVASVAFDPSDVQGEMMGQITNLLGEKRASQIQEIFQRSGKPGEGLLGGIVGGVVLLFGASSVFSELQAALNKVWRVKPDREQGGIRNFIFKRTISVAIVLGIAVLLMLSLGVNAMLALMDYQIGPYFSSNLSSRMLQVGHSLFSFVILTLLFALMYKFLPKARVRWRDVWLGAVVTTLLVVAGKFVLGVYLGSRDFGSVYGAAGSLVMILLWIHYTALIFYFGAEFTQTWSSRDACSVSSAEEASHVTRQDEDAKSGSAPLQTERHR